jgi:NAD-dependent deacetylase
MSKFQNIVVLTGAGLSAESGLGTFRGKGGLWENFRIEHVATPEGFARDPVLVHNFYNLRRSWHKKARPNAAHLALARLEREHGNVLTVTQNIDALHEAAGTRNLIHMHGELERALCGACGVSAPWTEDLTIETLCQACGAAAMRPDVVWFGEMPREMERIYEALGACDLFISIGTSGTVYPAAGFVIEARASGAHAVELNLEPSDGADLFLERIEGPATEIVPAYVDRPALKLKSLVMPGRSPGHPRIFLQQTIDVDGRDKPGHDGCWVVSARAQPPTRYAARRGTGRQGPRA